MAALKTLKILFSFFVLWAGLFSCTTVYGAAGEKAIPQLEKRLSLYPSNLKLKYVLSRAYATQGKADPRYYDKSIKRLEEIIKVKQIPVVKFFLGLVHARKGDLDTAIYHWRTIARSMKPNNLTTLRYLALALEKKKKHSESLKWWNKILSINPEDYKAHYHAALTTLRDLSVDPALRYSTAIRHFEKILSRYPDHKKSLWYLSLTYKSSRQYLKQRRVLNKLLVLAPTNERIVREKEINASNLERQPQDAVLQVKPDKPSSTSGAVSIATEITEDEFDAAFDAEPEPQEVPENHQPEPVEVNPTLPVDSPLSADAEILFNQGVQYMESGEYDLALFNFLQAQELDPKFAQCYLQIGEVYLKLSDTTPTEEKFKEHLRLSAQALETAVQLEPDSLLAHAAKAKGKEVERKFSAGFEAAHLNVARKALQNSDVRYAVEECIILLTNGFVSQEMVFSLADVFEKVDEGIKLDLNNVLQPLTTEGKPGAVYLQSRLELDSDLDRAFDLLDRLYEQESKDFFIGLKDRQDAGSADFLDHFILGRYLLNNKSWGPALESLDSSVKSAPSDQAKQKIEPYVQKARKGSRSLISSAIPVIEQHRNTGLKSQAFEKFNREKQEVLGLGADFNSIFSETPDLGILGGKREQLEVFLNSSPSNMLGNYILALTYENSTLDGVRDKARDMKTDSLGAHSRDSDWHLQMGLLAYRLKDITWGDKFFSQAEFILLKRGWEVYRPYALELSRAAREALSQSNLELARSFLTKGKLFHPLSQDLAQVRIELLERSGGSGILGFSYEYWGDLLSLELYSEIFKADVGLNLFWAIFLTLLFFCGAVVLKNQEELKHLVDELFGEKSLSVPLIAFTGGLLLIVFPTGLVVFLPILLWTYLDDFEQIFFIIGILALLVLPFLFPIGYVNNTDQLRLLRLMEEGEFSKVQKEYEARLKRNPLDVDARFQLALIDMNEGGGARSATSKYEQILAEYPDHFESLGNLGVCHARMGDYDRALQYFLKALNLNPISDKLLFNISRCYELKGDMKQAGNYLHYIGNHQEGGKAAVDRFLEYARRGEPIFAPFLLEGAVQRHDTLFGSIYESSLSGSLLLFLAWFFMGGGLVGFLLFLKDKMDVVTSDCRFCEKTICSNCQSIFNSEALCSDCFERPGRRKKGLREWRKERLATQLRYARILNFLAPGSYLQFRGKIMGGWLLAFFFWFFFLTWWHDFGVLWSDLFLMDNAFTSLMSLVAMGIAFLVYLTSSAAAIADQE